MVIKNSIPIIYEQNKQGVSGYCDVYSRLIYDRILFLREEIDVEVATNLVATLLWLDNISNEEITLYINSPGGTICDGLLSIYDTMQLINSPIKTVCIGEAYSAASIILAAGTPGRRFAYSHGKVMIHSIQVTDFSGPQDELEKESKRVKKINEVLMELTARHTSQPLEKVKRDCVEDKFMTAAEALKYGVIDEIIQPIKNIPELKRRKKA